MTAERTCSSELLTQEKRKETQDWPGPVTDKAIGVYSAWGLSLDKPGRSTAGEKAGN